MLVLRLLSHSHFYSYSSRADTLGHFTYSVGLSQPSLRLRDAKGGREGRGEVEWKMTKLMVTKSGGRLWGLRIADR